MIMNWMRKCKGSISIFLCLILLPMVTYSTIIIDASRMQTSKVNLSNAGDLTMNAALSEYDTILKDLYGLFAVSGHDSPEKFQKSLETYFRETIESNILTNDSDGTYVQDAASYLAEAITHGGALKKEDYDNLLNMQLNDFKCEPVQGSALANPATLKKQIIDYMKYRGPVSIATTLFPKLEFLKDSSKQTKAVKSKIEYTEQLSAMQDPCDIIYAILEGGGYSEDYNTGTPKLVYNDLTGDNALDPQPTLSDVINKSINKYLEETPISDIQSYTKENIEHMIYCQILQQNLPDTSSWNIPTLAANEETYPTNYSDWTSDYDSRGSKNYNELYGKVAFLRTQLEDMKNGVDTGMLDNIDGWVSELNSDSTSSDFTGAKAEMDRKFNLAHEINSNTGLVEAIKDFYNAKRCFGDVHSKMYGYTGTIYEKMRDKLLSGEIDGTKFNEDYYDYYDPAWDKCAEINGYNDFYSNYDDKINALYAALNADNLKKPYEYYANKFYENSCHYPQIIDGYNNSLKKMMDQVVESTGELKTAFNNSIAARDKWKENIENVSSTTIRENMMSDYNATVSSFDSEDNKKDIDAFSDYVTAQQTRLKDRIDSLENAKLNGKTIWHDCSASDLAGSYGCGITNTSQAELTNKLNEAIGSFTNIDSAPYDSYLEPIEGRKTYDATLNADGEEFFKTIKSIACPKDGKFDKDGKKSWESIKADSKVADGKPSDSKADGLKKEDTALTKNDDKNYFNAITDIAGYTSSSAASSASASKISGLSGDSIPEDKDDIKDLKKDENSNGKSSLNAGESILDSIANLGATVVNSVYLEEYFTEMFTCQTDALAEDTVKDADGKTTAINSTKYKGFNKDFLDHNAPWYGKEVEYILWGNQNLDTCLLENEALIFTIRFALNAIYAFTASDIQIFALETATAIAGWTVVGVPIVKAIITVAIALAESAYDLNLLKNGEDVPIYKNASTFVCSPNGVLAKIKETAADAISTLAKDVVERVASKVEQRIDNFIDSVSDRMEESLETFVNEKADDINNFVEDMLNEKSAAVRSAAENIFINPIIDQLNTVYTVYDEGLSNLDTVIEEKIDAAFVEINNRIDQLDEGLVKEVAKEAYNYIDADTGSMKESIKAKVKEYFENLKNTTGDLNPLQTLRESITGDKGVIANYFNNANTNIKSFVDTNKTKILNNLKSTKNKKVADLKSCIHKEVDNVSSSITGKISSATSSLSGGGEESSTKVNLSKDPLNKTPDAGSESGGVTLNYKEYCKIFVLIHIVADEEVMLQRAAAIMDRNVNYKKYGYKTADDSKDKPENEKFSMTKANTMMSLEAKVKMSTIFPWNNVEVSVDDTKNGFDPVFTPAHYGPNFVNIKYNGVSGY